MCRVSPGEWCTFAGDAVQVLEPVRKAVSDAGLTPVHKVVMESLKVVTPLVALLFPGGKVRGSGLHVS